MLNKKISRKNNSPVQAVEKGWVNVQDNRLEVIKVVNNNGSSIRVENNRL